MSTDAALKRMINHTSNCKDCVDVSKRLSEPKSLYEEPLYSNKFVCGGRNVCVVDTVVEVNHNLPLIMVNGKREMDNVIYSGVNPIVVNIPTNREGGMKCIPSTLKDITDLHIPIPQEHVQIIFIDIRDTTMLVEWFVKCVKRLSVKDLNNVVNHINTFTPDYITNGNLKSRIKNAMIEVKELYRITNTAIKNNLDQLKKYVNEETKSHRPTKSEGVVPATSFGIFNGVTGGWVVEPSNKCKKYQKGYLDGKFVDIEKCFNAAGRLVGRVVNGVIALNKDSAFINSTTIVANMNDVDLDTVDLDFTIEIVTGVAGCGKTYEIIRDHRASIDTHGAHDVVITSSRKTAEDLQARLATQKKDMKAVTLAHDYRTCGSSLMNLSHGRRASGQKIDCIYFDEGLMRHFGDIF